MKVFVVASFVCAVAHLSQGGELPQKNHEKRGISGGLFGGIADIHNNGLSLGGSDLHGGLGVGLGGGYNGLGGLSGAHVTTLTRRVPVPIAQPYPVTINRAVPYPVKQPVAIEVPRPVHVPVPVAKPVIVPRPVPVQINRPYPVPVPHPVPVPVPQPIKVPVPQPYPVTVPKPVPVKVAQPVVVNVPQPVYVGKGGLGGLGGLGGAGLGKYTNAYNSGIVNGAGSLGYGGSSYGYKGGATSYNSGIVRGYNNGPWANKYNGYSGYGGYSGDYQGGYSGGYSGAYSGGYPGAYSKGYGIGGTSTVDRYDGHGSGYSGTTLKLANGASSYSSLSYGGSKY